MVYATNYASMAYCDGTSWISMAGGVSVTIGGVTGATALNDLTDVDTAGLASGDYLKYNGASWVPDNPFGTLTNGKWCTSDGTSVICNSDAPVLTEVDPQVDTLTANAFCRVNAGGTAIDCGSDAPTQRTALGLGTMALQNADAVAISGGSITGLTSLSVAGIITATYFEGDGSRLTGLSTGPSDRIVSGTSSVVAHENTGVSMSAPLQVDGAIQVAGTDSELCNGPDDYGKIRFNTTLKSLQICQP